MSSQNLYYMTVIKARLRGQGERGFPDCAMVLASSSEEAIKTIKNHRWSNALWEPGKSVCRILRIVELGSLAKPGVLLLKDTSDLRNIFAGDERRVLQLVGRQAPAGEVRELEAVEPLAAVEEPPSEGRRRRRRA